MTAPTDERLHHHQHHGEGEGDGEGEGEGEQRQQWQWDALPKELLEDCAQLTKANSIEGPFVCAPQE